MRSSTLPDLELEIDSAGTHGYHIGSPPDPRSVEAAARRGLDITNLRARMVDAVDFERFDLIVAMDRLNREALLERAPRTSAIAYGYSSSSPPIPSSRKSPILTTAATLVSSRYSTSSRKRRSACCSTSQAGSRPLTSPLMPRALDYTRLEAGTLELAARDPHLGAVVSRLGTPPMFARRPGFATLVKIILEQQVSIVAARTMFLRLDKHVSGTSPSTIAALGIDGLRRFGLTRQKSRTAMASLRAFSTGDWNLPRSPARKNPPSVTVLEIPGIGLDGDYLSDGVASARRLAAGRSRPRERHAGGKGNAEIAQPRQAASGHRQSEPGSGVPWRRESSGRVALPSHGQNGLPS